MSIVLENLTKRYDDHAVVNNVSLEIGNGEFFVLLGSSGSGKTTILNLIAGLTALDQGRIFLHGREVTNTPTQERRVGFVFQHYALFEHMTVAENIEFGPSVQKVPRAERRDRREELLELVGLTGLGDRYPRQLSGGQQQRVALARALALQPDVLLLDEPLGALDAKIRLDLRRSLRNVQQKLGITAILVTHDQEEAFDLADRIGIMSIGRLLEVGTPADLYQRPKTEFVASFLGSANLLVGDALDGVIQIGTHGFVAPQSDAMPVNMRRAQILFRPEDVALAAQPEGLGCPELGVGQVEEVSFGGPVERLRLRLPPIAGIRPISPPVPFGTSSILIDAARPPDEATRFSLQPGDRVHIGVRRVHALANPGLSCLILSDGTPRSQAAFDLGGHIARLAHARVLLLGCAQPEEGLQESLQEARKQIGSGPAVVEVQAAGAEQPHEAVARMVERQPFDLVVYGWKNAGDLHEAEQIYRAGEHHLLMAPVPQAAPTRTLICVASGEPSKDDVFFTGRLIHHIGSQATLMTVVPASEQNTGFSRTRAERFLDSGLNSLALLGVEATAKIRAGAVTEEIVKEVKEGGYDLLVLGGPLEKADGTLTFAGVIRQVLLALPDCPTLLIQSARNRPNRFASYA